MLVIATALIISSCSSEAEYTGETKDGLHHGWGTLVYPNGTSYVGEFKEGIREGEGTWKHQNGTIYSGIWQNDRYHGQGILVILGMLTYEGEWVEGLREGYGIQTWDNNEGYEGFWKNDRRHGHGKMHYADGSSYEGQWDQGLRSGEGVLSTAGDDKITIEQPDDQISYIPVESMRLSDDNLIFNLGEDSVNLEALIIPDNATDRQIAWSSSNTAVATVNNGIVTPVSTGSAVITATAIAEELLAECRVTVRASPSTSIAVTQFYMNQTSLLLRIGGRPEQLSVIIKPDQARNTTVYWSSSNPKIAAVGPTGFVTARQVGETTITAQIPGGRFSDTATVVVIPPLE